MLTTTAAGRAWDYTRSIGRNAFFGLGLTQVQGVAFGDGDVVYVLSRGAEYVAEVAWNRTSIGARVGIITIGDAPDDEELVTDFVKYGDEDGRMIWPAGIARDSQGEIYITDEWLNRVCIYDKEGNFLKHWGSEGDGDGDFNRMSGIAIDRDDNVYVVDSLNHRIQKMTADGGYLSKWGSLGSGPGQMNSPWGICIDDEGYVYVADHKNHRAQKFAPNGEFVASYGQQGDGPGQLYLPSDVAVDPEGDVYVCDWTNDRVQIFASDGVFITSLIGDAQEPSRWGKLTIDGNADVVKARRRVASTQPEWGLAMPTGVDFDPKRRSLFIADTGRARLQIYKKLEEYQDPQFNL